MATSMLSRLNPERTVETLSDHLGLGGGRGLAEARAADRRSVVAAVVESGLRGRGGAGFPTGRKWQTVLDHSSDLVATTVVVNGAEGEPGSFKDRHLLRERPHLVLEGALIAALAVEAPEVVVALKAASAQEIARVESAIDEITASGWTEGIRVGVFAGPDAYLYGEETALLEAFDGRDPFPRIAPPFRHGAREVSLEADAPGSAAEVRMAATTDETLAPPTLVNNVETLANVPGILAGGAEWFRELGTDESPGSILCTVSGDTNRAGVGEYPMGTPLGQVIDELGDGMAPGRRIGAVLSGVSNAIIPSGALDTPLTYEAMSAAGTGLGSAGFIVFDDTTDPIAIAEGVARFLAVESCGQCVPCKRDGLELAGRLGAVRRSQPDSDDAEIQALAERVIEGARCNLAHQQREVILSVLSQFPDAVDEHLAGSTPADPVLIAPIVEMSDGRVVLDERHAKKQPDWTYGDEWGGRWPAQDEDS